MKTKPTFQTLALVMTLLAIISSQVSNARAQGTAFTYQGRLNDGANPANGTYDLRFAIYDSTNVPGTVVAGPTTNSATAVTNGLFTVSLDFGASIFTGADRWVEVAARTNGATSFVTLAPRQKLAPTPYAIAAGNLTAVIANNNVSGANATVGGGDENTASGSRSTVSGGETNTASGTYSTVAGGLQNTATNGGSTVSGGNYNVAGGILATVGGGNANMATGLFSTVGGGDINHATGDYSTIPGGENNYATGQYSFAAGQRAEAFHQGTFVWADSQSGAFPSTANDQFLIRAQGGVGIGTRSPLSQIEVNGTARLDASPTSYNEGLTVNLPTDMPNGGYGGIHFHNAARNGTFDGTTIRWGMFYNYTPEAGTTGSGLSFVQSNLYTRLFIASNGNVGIGITTPASPLHVNGDVTAAGNVNFGAQTRQMINLWGTQYGIGVQSYTTYFRTDNSAPGGNFAWYQGGVHNDGQLNPGGGKTLMVLDNTGGLTVSGALTTGGALNLPAASPAINSGGTLLLHADSSQNLALGNAALNNNSSGSGNTANGFFALLRNTIGNFNTAVGVDALENNTSGGNNIAVGTTALYANTNGNFNTAVGYGAFGNTTNASQNIGLGYQAGNNITTGSSNICIGNLGVSNDANTIRIGNLQTRAFMAGIESVAVPLGTPVYVGTNNQLGTTISSARFKQGIRDMGDASDGLLSLRPVTFQYKEAIDPHGTPQFGLVAEEVARVNPDLVLRDGQGSPFTVRYDAVNAMLLNEFLKQHQTVKSQNSEIQHLKQQNEALKNRLDNLEQMVQSLLAKE